MQRQKIRPWVLPGAIVIGLLLHRQLASLREVTPWLIFTILLLFTRSFWRAK